ncbi:MAG TPA: hypothetical protein VE338_19135 [Ktedonobacterales bacterium]|jgi:3-oxoacyl-ACP reductase-like protein|nr:hypothetical protein [Ktedonobacterales bacterium]
MTEKAQRHDGEEAREDREGLTTEMSHELASERETQRDLTGATTDTTDATDATGANEQASAPDTAKPSAAPERPRAPRASRKAAAAKTSATEAANISALSAIEADRIELEAQGFSPDEAQRLIDISKRLETSAEARASQAELKRLRFAQWLIEHGILDEFSA